MTGAAYLKIVLAIAIMSLVATLRAEEATPAEKGKKTLQSRAFNPIAWSLDSYEKAWKFWGSNFKQRPKNYDQAFREHYGLHVAPYANGKYPMGIRKETGLLGKGLTVDCLLCHGGSIVGQSVIGLGNASLDMQSLFEDLSRADGRSGKLPFTFCNVRGTSEAGGMSVFLLGLRNPNLGFRFPRLNLGLHADMCEDVPAWWLLKKKKTMYHTGGANARSVRSIMQFMLASLYTRETFEKEESTFRNIQAYLISLEPPKYPYPIDQKLAGQGKLIFAKTCATCHGSYGKDWTYPNKIVALDKIGTDRKRFEGISREFAEYYNRSWFAEEKGQGQDYRAKQTIGYQAPPLDGVWASAPYFHNGSAATVYQVLNSKAQPKYFTRSFRTGKEDYDPRHLGWKITILDKAADPKLPMHKQRKVYDTTLPGRSNTGHPFGDQLSERQRKAVIEYLKTL